ncbi:fibronectin type III domain-containing protein [uncultured Jatrophihabitans sp.]|uniref:fibronectin type III domain-containing protein n=1 Tax=uncultured Jatrophihabitans sp. TaxID=1610747 RepID=UPI0035CC4B3B
MADAQGTPPPWVGANSDPNAVGGLTFYNAAGAAITSGSTNSAPFANYVLGRAATQDSSLSNPTATVYLYLPHEGLNQESWHDADQLGGSTNYPNSQAPGSLATAGPLNTGSNGDLTIESVESDYPNTSTTTGYQGVYEARLYTSAAGSSGSVHYDYADISVNNTTHTWTLVYSPGSAPTAAAPGAPTAVHASPGNASATVSWTAPASNGGAAITGYHVQYSANNGGTWADGPASAQSSTATTATVTGLANGTAYEFQVAAINSVGTGAYSAASSAVTPAPPTAPGAPTAAHAIAGNASATVSWTAPASNGGAAITGYHVQYSANNGGTWADGPASAQSSTATTATVTGLANGTAYEFQVAAINSVGTGAYSAASSAVTPAPPTAPGAPTAVHATAGNASATVSWTAPASNGGAAIIGYDLEYSANNGGTWASVSPSFHTSTATTGNVTGLTNGTTYEFRVAAINSAGAGAYSAASAPITPSAPVVDASKLTITAVSTVKYGTAVSVSGTLTDARTSAAIGGQKVKLYGRRGSAAFAAITTVTTSSRGVATASVKPTSTEQFEWVYSGAATHKAVTSAVKTVTVTQVVAAHVTAKHRKHGKRVKFYGTVSPNAKGQRVALQILVKGKWKTVKKVVVRKQKMPNRHTRTGFVISYKLRKGTTKFRLYKGARSSLAAGHSKRITVRGT